MFRSNAFDWRTITALNAVSTLSQIGQFGIGFVVLPVWLANQGLDAAQLGVFAAALWLGQVPGLAIAPIACKRWGPRWVVVAGLLCSLAAMPWLALMPWPWQPLGGILCGFGMGLRWIGVEPWLYHIAPDTARGRLVGFHETLIAIAPIAAPMLGNIYGLEGHAVLWMGGIFCVASLLPLMLAKGGNASTVPQAGHHTPSHALAALKETVFRQGLVIALLGGMMEAAVSGLFAVFAQDRGVTPIASTGLLAIFGMGGLLLQYPMGWLADHHGMGRAATASAAGVAVAALTLLWPLNYFGMQIAVFFLGGFITAFLTLALIASTLAQAGSMARNVSTVSMVYTASAVAGPLIASAAIQTLGSGALMGFTALAACAMAALLSLRTVSGRID